MDLLPKSSAEFHSKSYWDDFFQKRKDAFEWYGEYLDLCAIIHRYCKLQDRVLMSGCGNSKLSEDMYDVGFKSIFNIDISETAIKRMTNKNEESRPEMKYKVMDITQTTFEDCEYNVVLDKGTLDAIYSDGSTNTIEEVKKMFAEINRVLKVGGRYLCVTLAQEHILHALVEHFKEFYLIRVHIVQQNEDSNSNKGLGSRLPVFVFVLTKMPKKLGTPVLEISFHDAESSEKIASIDLLIQKVQEIQHYAVVQDRLAKSSIEEAISVDLWTNDPKAMEPRYTLTVVDTNYGNQGKFAIFIVPQGRELEWIFASDDGRKQLGEMAGFRRLVVATLHRGHDYTNIDEIKSELSTKVMDLAPANLPDNYQAPFLTAGADDVGWREVKYEGCSELTGSYVIEDVQDEDKAYYRRLLFRSNINTIQTQARLVSEKSSKKSKKKKRVVDPVYLLWEIQKAMIMTFSFLTDFVPLSDSITNILVIGVGGGSLPSFLAKTLPNLQLTCVDLDPDVISVAKTWFGLVESDKLKCIAQDGLLFLQDQIEKGLCSSYDIIIIDVNGRDNKGKFYAPPDIFLEKEVLQNVSDLLKPNGIFTLNGVRNSVHAWKQMVQSIKYYFPHIYSAVLEQEENKPVFCVRNKIAVETVMKSVASMQQTIIKIHGGKLSSKNFDMNKIAKTLVDI